MKRGDSGSSGSDELLALVELQLQLAESNKILLEEKERSKQHNGRSKFFLLKEMKRILDGEIVRWGCVMNKLLHKEKECSQESNRVLEELLNEEKKHSKQLERPNQY